MLSGEIAERNFCSHCCSAREPSLEKPARMGAASCCAKSVQATEIRTASMTKLRRIIPEPRLLPSTEFEKLYARPGQIRSYSLCYRRPEFCSSVRPADSLAESHLLPRPKAGDLRFFVSTSLRA